jgi:hypothetical protein
VRLSLIERTPTPGYAVSCDLQLKRYRRAVDPAALQRVADLNALGLVREGTDPKTVEGAEIADIDFLDLRRNAFKTFALGDFFPQGFCFVFRTASGELETVAA